MGFADDYFNELNKKKKKNQQSVTSTNNYATEYHNALQKISEEEKGSALSWRNDEEDIAPVRGDIGTDKSTVETTQAIFDKYGQYYNSPDYDEYSQKGAAIKNPSAKEAEGWASFFGKPIGGKEVGNIVTYSRDNYDEMKLGELNGGGSSVGKAIYYHMTDFEVGIYNYLLAKEGKDAAQEFLDDIEETLNAREGGMVAESIQNSGAVSSAILHGMVSVGSGVESFGTGVKQLFSEEALPTTSTEFLNQELLNDLDGFAKQAYQTGNVVGNMMPSVAVGAINPKLGYFIQGSSAAGNAYRNSLKEGKTKEEAATFGVMIGAMEYITSKFIGGVEGMTGSLPQKALKNIATFENALLRVGAKYAVNIGSEITEEELQLWLEPAARSLVFGEDYDAPTLEEMAETAIVTALSTGVLNSSTDIATGNLTKVNGLTQHEAKVVDKLYNDAIAEQESKGKKLTNKDKNKLYDRIVYEMKRGYVTTDEIESILGGETYKGYKDLTDKKTSLEERKTAIENEIKSLVKTPESQFTVEQREKLTSLREEAKGIKEALQNLGIKTAKNKLFNEVNKLTAKDTYLRESYNDLIRQTQDLQIDENQYNGTKFADAAKKTIANARKAEASNSNRVRDFVEFAAKYSSVSGTVVDFKDKNQIRQILENQLKAEITTLQKSTTEEDKTKLAEIQDMLKQVQEGEIHVNGVKTKDGVAINLKSPNYLNVVLGHEVTHFLEGKNAYEPLQKAIFKYAKTKGDYEGRRKVLDVLYKNVKGTTVDYELTADLVGDYLFNEYDFIKSLSTENRNVFQYVFDQIKYVYKLATAGSKEARELEKVMHQFEKVLRESTETSQSIEHNETATQFSLRTKPAPKKTQEVYKLMRLKDGEIYPLFIDSTEPLKVGEWYDADSPNLDFLKEMPSGVFLVDANNGTYQSYDEYLQESGERKTKYPSKNAIEKATAEGKRWVFIEDTAKAQKRFDGETRKYWNIGINGSGSVSTFSMRPGYHAGSLPTMRQIGKGANRDLRDDSFVWTVGEVPADIDYQAEAEQNPDKDIPTHIPEDGYYLKATNADKAKSQADRVGWYVAGSYKINRIISDSEARQVIDNWNAEHPDTPVEYDYDRESGMDFDADQMKLVPKSDTKFSISKDSKGNQLSPAVQKRFEKSKAVDENGNLKVLYHGTASGEFFTFDKAKGSVEGDFGSGFYFTDNEYDVERNYEDGGPDFDNKVARRAEQIEAEEDIEYSEAEARAREELYVGGKKFEVYLNIENPCFVGETNLFDYDSYASEYDPEDYDSEEDYEGDVEQLIADDIDQIIWDIERNVDVYNMDGVAEVLWSAVNEGGIDVEQLKANINNLYLEDSNGNLVGNEVTRQIIESLGYDGIIDNTVSHKFSNMGLSEDTTHYIVFKPNQIKDISNQNPTDNPDIRFSLSKSALDNEGDLVYNVNGNFKRGDGYVRTVEFRKLQAESQRMSDEDIQSYRSGSKRLDEGLRADIARVLRAQIDSYRNGLRNDDGLLNLTNKGNEFNMCKSVNGSLFHDCFEISQRFLVNGELVDLHEVKTTEDGIGYDDCDNYLSEDGLSGFSVTPEGDLISVFNASGKKGFLGAISPFVKHNTKTLDCYNSPNQPLCAMYEKMFGFKTASVMDYNMEYDHDNIAENHNMPKVAFMVNTESDVETKYFTKDEYDEAKAYRDSFVNQTTDNDIAPTENFSLSNEGEKRTLGGSYRFNGKDFRVKSDQDIAPVAEGIAKNATTETTSSKMEQVAGTTPKSTRIADGTRGDELLNESLDNYPMETVEQKVAENIRAIEGELADNRDIRREAEANYDSQIAKLQKEYNSKKNKETKVAYELLQSISRLERLKASTDAKFAKRISDLEARLEKMKEPKYTRAMQRRVKMAEHARFAANLLGNTATWVDKKLGLQYATNTERRNLRDIVRDENGNVDIARADAINDALNGQYNREEADRQRELAQVRKKYADLKITKAEDKYIQMLGELRHNPDTRLSPQEVNEYLEKHKDKIDETKVDKIIELARQDYDNFILRVNEALREQGMREIPYRKGYFPHFVNPKQNFVQKLFNWKTQDNEIPTSIAGLTEEFKPVKSWQSFDKERTGDKTDYSFTKGFDMYSNGVLDWIYHLDTIQKRRAVENHIRSTHSDEGITKRIKEVYANEEYDANEAQAQIENILSEAANPLNNFVQDFMTHTNILAGKKNSLDRTTEQMTNRHIYSVMQNVQNRTSANMVLANVRSALTNFIPITQSWAQVSPLRSIQATKDTIANAIKDDGLINKSTFLTNRLREADSLYKTNWDVVLDKAGIMFEIVDNFSSQVIWRSKYNQNLDNGMTEAEAIANADQFAENVMAGRSKGNEPTLFNAKNPLVKAFTMFQLEVNNQYGYLFKDVPNDLKAETNHWKLNLAKGYTTAFIGAYVYNALLEQVAGSGAALDPIGIIEDLLKDLGLFDDDEEKETAEIITNLMENVGGELPFVGGTLFGGGRIPISSALPYGDNGLVEGVGDFVTDVTEGNWKNIGKEMMNPILNVGLPVGGGQLKKTVQGLKMFSDEHPVTGSYTDSGSLRFPVEDTLGNRIQAGIFGQYASKNAREYFDNDYAPLKEKQIQEYQDVDLPIADYWKYREGLSGLKTNEEKADYINSLDIENWQKNLLLNNILDRKEDVDMSNYDDFADFEEFDYAQKNPEKYAFAKSVGGYSSYKTYSDALYSIKADKDSSGKSISGSRKEKVLNYINNLDADYETKIILWKSEYPSDDTYNMEIINYINNRGDLTYEERVAIFQELGFTVSDGSVYWD